MQTLTGHTYELHIGEVHVGACADWILHRYGQTPAGKWWCDVTLTADQDQPIHEWRRAETRLWLRLLHDDRHHVSVGTAKLVEITTKDEHMIVSLVRVGQWSVLQTPDPDMDHDVPQ